MESLEVGEGGSIMEDGQCKQVCKLIEMAYVEDLDLLKSRIVFGDEHAFLMEHNEKLEWVDILSVYLCDDSEPERTPLICGNAYRELSKMLRGTE